MAQLRRAHREPARAGDRPAQPVDQREPLPTRVRHGPRPLGVRKLLDAAAAGRRRAAGLVRGDPAQLKVNAVARRLCCRARLLVRPLADAHAQRRGGQLHDGREERVQE